MLAVSMPKAATRSALVDTATKCFATADVVAELGQAHARARAAFVRVSSVREGLRGMMNSVVCGVEVAGRLGEVRAVDVGHEPHVRARSL